MAPAKTHIRYLLKRSKGRTYGKIEMGNKERQREKESKIKERRKERVRKEKKEGKGKTEIV